MKSNSPKNPFPDSEHDFKELFRVREMAPADFVEKTLKAARAKRRQGRIMKFTAWAGGVAACFALLLGISSSGPLETPERLAEAPTVERAAGPTSADELTAALYATFSNNDVVFYAQARALDALLADAIALSEEETVIALDLLILLAQN